jgi:hypothetical protein
MLTRSNSGVQFWPSGWFPKDVTSNRTVYLHSGTAYTRELYLGIFDIALLPLLKLSIIDLWECTGVWNGCLLGKAGCYFLWSASALTFQTANRSHKRRCGTSREACLADAVWSFHVQKHRNENASSEVSIGIQTMFSCWELRHQSARLVLIRN